MKDFKEIVSFLRDKGFVYAGSEIYGGLANSWDYGPLGSMLKNNIKKVWSKHFIYEKINNFELDSSIILNTNVWKSTGHLEKFNDPVIECLNDNKRYRADHLIEDYTEINPVSLSLQEMTQVIKERIKLPEFKEKTKWGEVKEFQLMFKTSDSKTGQEGNDLYLRPETAQGIYINFKNIVNTYNLTLPFGVGQIGKSFRNEVTPGNFVFRTKEFEQMELQNFIYPKDEIEEFDSSVNDVKEFLKRINISENNIRLIDVPKDELAHYSKRTIDFEYKFLFGWGELLGIANRTNFDLKNHMENSKENLFYIDQKNNNEKIIPYIIETSIGVERLLLAIISDNLKTINEREILTLPYDLAPYKLAITPLTNKVDDEAYHLYKDLLKKDIGPIFYSKSGSIGKRYRKLDQIGVPFIITFDFDSLEDHKVTIRHRDTMEQQRINISEIKEYIIKNAK